MSLIEELDLFIGNKQGTIEYYEYKLNMNRNVLELIINMKDQYQIENIKFINDKISECEAEIRKLKIENIFNG